MRTIAIAVLALCLSACALYPVKPYSNRKQLVVAGDAEGLQAIDLATARAMIVGLRVVLMDSSRDRERLSLVASESLFYGSLLAAIGVATDSIATRNVGGGVAALSTVMSNHYQPSTQEAAFHKAGLRALCIEDAIAPISPEVRIFLPRDLKVTRPDQSVDDVSSAFDKVPDVTLGAINTIDSDLEVALAGIALAAPSKDDLQKTFADWNDAKKKANNSKPTTGDGSDATVENALHQSNDLVHLQAFAQITKVAPAKITKADIVDAAESCSAAQVDASPETQAACRLLRIAAKPQVEIEDMQRAFVAAVETYKTTVDACLAQHTQ
jgi:hypothetical protein